MSNKKSILFKLYQYYKRYTPELIMAYLIMLVSTGLTLLFPLLVQDIVNNFDINILQIIVILILLISSLILMTLSTYIFSVVGNKVTADIRKQAWDSALYQKIESIDAMPSGILSSKIVNDAMNITNFISSVLPSAVIGIISLIAAIIIMFSLNWMLTLALVLLIPMIFIVILPISRKVNLISERQQKIIGKSNGYFSETIAQLRLIKSYGTERFESERGKSEIDEIYNLGKNNAKVISVLTPLLGTVMTILFLTVIGIGAYNVSRGTLTSGALVAFFLYFFEVINPIQSLANFFVEIQEFEGRTKELFQFIENELENLESGRTPKELGSIQFSNVSFKYKHKDKQALSNVSFTIQHGKKTSIVGASGSGKTTIISLLEQFYIPQSGSITLESTPIHIFSLKKWRNMFSYVSQDSKIITGTIKENILYGTSGTVSDAELTEISKIANIYEYISQLPEKFDTWVGERGILLSGGQRQRISIARALIKNSEYLLLDEATSNLDYDSEEKIQKSIKYLQNGKTSVMIAHKLSSVIDSDNIIVLEDGKVTGVGTHWELINTNTYYNKWANMQIGNKYALT